MAAPSAPAGLVRFALSNEFGLVALIVLFGAWFAAATPGFASPFNLFTLGRIMAIEIMIGFSMMVVIVTGGLNLSVGAIGVCSAMVFGWLSQRFGLPLVLTIPAALAMGAALGAINGQLIVRSGLHSFIITLATLTSLRGIGLLITNGSTISISNDAFTNFARADFLGVPSLFWMVIVVAIPAYVFLHLSRWGRYLFAVGSNREAARLSGVNVNRTIYLAYILSSTCAAFVGILLASRIGIGNATQAEGWELQAIASSVIGGTSLFGAVGSVQGPLLGAFILATINNGANLLNVNSFWQRIITGALIILIVYFDQLRRRGSR